MPNVLPPLQQLVPTWDTTANRASFNGTYEGDIETFNAVQIGNGLSAAVVPMGVAPRAGIIQDVRMAAVTPLTGNDTYTVDIKKNGTTVLTAPMALLTSTAARASVVGVLAVANTPVAAGDFFEAAITYTHGTGTAPANIVAQLQLVLN